MFFFQIQINLAGIPSIRQNKTNKSRLTRSVYFKAIVKQNYTVVALNDQAIVIVLALFLGIGISIT